MEDKLRFLPIILAYWILFYPPVWSGDPKQIELKDGSVITGDVLSLSNDVFTIHKRQRRNNPHQQQPDPEDPQPYRTKGGTRCRRRTVRTSEPGMESQIRALQQAAAGDPELQKQILSLQDDPDFQAALQDPDMLSAVQSGDIDALLNHPKIQKLTGNPHVSEIQKRLP